MRIADESSSEPQTNSVPRPPKGRGYLQEPTTEIETGSRTNFPWPGSGMSIALKFVGRGRPILCLDLCFNWLLSC